MNKVYPATLFRLLWFALLTASPLSEVLAKNSPNLQLNGVSDYTSLGTQQFIAALYLETPSTDAEEVLAADTAIMLEMRISADRLSQRRFNRHWIESATINSDSEQMKEQINNFSRFSKFFKGQLLRGDNVELEYNPQRGDVAVKLNSFTLGHIRSKAFFKLLLRSWIGDIPLSSEFRQELLSPNAQNPQLLAHFNSLMPSAARLRETKGWNSPSPKKIAVKKQAPAARKVQKQAQKTPPHISQPLVNSLQVAKQKAKPVATASSRVEAKRNTSAPKGNNTVRKTKNSRTKSKNSAQTKETTPPPTQATWSAGSTGVLIPPQTTTENDVKSNTTGSTSNVYEEAALLAHQQYYKQLSSQVYKFQTLPRQAFQRRLEGDARVSITINRSGQVIDVRLEKESKHDIFNQQALDAVKNASPFPPVPQSIRGETYTFSVPINYKLPY